MDLKTKLVENVGPPVIEILSYQQAAKSLWRIVTDPLCGSPENQVSSAAQAVLESYIPETGNIRVALKGPAREVERFLAFCSKRMHHF